MIVKGSTDTVRMAAPAGHSANKALLLSLIPGGGQIYNHQAWKLPIIYGAFGVMGYLIYDNYTQMALFKNEYLYRVNHGDQPDLSEWATYPSSSIYNMYQSYNQYFQLMVIITAGIYALNLVDAYVFGHLFDFNVDDDLSMHIGPTVTPVAGPFAFAPSMGVTLKF